jgi:hypothetical protein
MPITIRMPRVLVESPYAPSSVDASMRIVQLRENIEYARSAVRDCLRRGEAPYASHLFFTQPGLLDDRVASQRALGIEAGLTWGAAADKTVVYADRGISPGMQVGMDRAVLEGRPIEIRYLGDPDEAPPL